MEQVLKSSFDPEIIFKKQYLAPKDIQNIIMYYETMNDSYANSRGPYPNRWLELGWQGCWDSKLRLDMESNPIHILTEKLKKDFGDMIFWRGSVRHFCAPFDVHDDYPHKEKDLKTIESLGLKGTKKGYTFLIPLWWQKGYKAGTAFFNAPPKKDEPLYEDCQEKLSKFNKEHYKIRVPKNYTWSVRKIIDWENPGDLIAWENYTWHCSTHTPNLEYSKDRVIKRFLSLDCFITD